MTYSAPEQVAVTGMTLEKKSIEVEKGKTETINAIITPENATRKGITGLRPIQTWQLLQTVL